MHGLGTLFLKQTSHLRAIILCAVSFIHKGFLTAVWGVKLKIGIKGKHKALGKPAPN